MLIPIWQKLIGFLVYMLPWSDALPFGRSLFTDFPFLQWLALPALPLIILQQAIPFGNLILFFVLFLAVARNPKIPYFLRFNTLQALLIDIALILISYAFQVLIRPLGSGLIVNTLSSTVLIAVLSIVIFAFGECIQGKEPDLPGISEAVRMQI
ncbi:Tic20 family protein [Prochlorococcus sp. MIT 1307]|uniref:Tic20 family protein n=1 Tax=Prochlorococcus sp. MIT 1307 TaxID=3096219 RepID=UPI002A758B6D|nr:Tic20 family protein [Prochlorococcus sp. MIT 1307]